MIDEISEIIGRYNIDSETHSKLLLDLSEFFIDSQDKIINKAIKIVKESFNSCNS